MPIATGYFGSGQKLTSAGVLVLTPVSEQVVKLRLRRLVAFACSFLQSLDIEYLYLAARVPDHSCLLQRMRNDGDTASSHAKHLRQEFLREVQRIAAR